MLKPIIINTSLEATTKEKWAVLNNILSLNGIGALIFPSFIFTNNTSCEVQIQIAFQDKKNDVFGLIREFNLKGRTKNQNGEVFDSLDAVQLPFHLIATGDPEVLVNMEYIAGPSDVALTVGLTIDGLSVISDVENAHRGLMV